MAAQAKELSHHIRCANEIDRDIAVLYFSTGVLALVVLNTVKANTIS